MSGRNVGKKRKGGVAEIPQKAKVLLPRFDQCKMLSSALSFADPSTLVRAGRTCSLVRLQANEAAMEQAGILAKLLDSWGETELSAHVLDQVSIF